MFSLKSQKQQFFLWGKKESLGTTFQKNFSMKIPLDLEKLSMGEKKGLIGTTFRKNFSMKFWLFFGKGMLSQGI